jgi:chromosome segregation ATPase
MKINMNTLEKQLEEAKLDLKSYNMQMEDYVNYLRDAEKELANASSRIKSCYEWINRYETTITNVENRISDLLMQLEA